MNRLEYYVSPKEEVISYCSVSDVEIVNTNNKLINFIINQLFKFKFLKRKEVTYKDTINYYKVSINLDDVIKALDDYNYELFSRYNLKPKLIVVGRDIYHKLTRQVLQHPYHINLTAKDVVKQYWDCTLFMCPYVEGVFVIPEIN